MRRSATAISGPPATPWPRARQGIFVWNVPVQINGKRGNALLLSEADWNAIQETLHLVAIPGMRESILEGLATPLEDLSDQPGW